MKKIGLFFVIIPFVVGMAFSGWTATFTVTPTSDNDCADFNCNLQSALNTAATDDEDDTINMSDGTFNGPFTYTTTKNFSLTLIGTGSTLIDGQNSAQGILINTSTFDDTNAHILLKNISFQNGNNHSYSGGGGIHISTNKSNVALEYCILRKNSARDGGGAHIETVSGHILLKGNMFEENSVQNLAGGGANIGSSSGEITLEGNLFANNSSRFHGGGLSAFSETGDIKIINNLFIANSANVFGGGASLADIPLDGGAPGVITVVNNTFVSNSAVSSGGGLSITLDNTTSRADLYNNILWGNSSDYYGDDIIICDDCSGASTAGAVNLYNNNFSDFYSTCQNQSGCTPKITQAYNNNLNPLFVNITDPDPNQWDVHLTSNSPCIDAGNGNAPDLPATDYHGDPRTFGYAPDMGVYESPYELSLTVSTPTRPAGSAGGTMNTFYSYSTGGATSSLGNPVVYQFDWKGDGSDLSPYGPATQSKTWTVAGTYNVRARARDTLNTSGVSDWSSGLLVTIVESSFIALQSPANGAVFETCSLVTKYQPSIQWTSGEQFSKYTILFSTSASDFTKPVTKASLKGTITNWTASASIWKKLMTSSYNGGSIQNVYWKIVGERTNKTAEESATWSFRITTPQAVTIQSPSDGVGLSSGTPPAFDFSTNCNVKVKLEISSLNDFSNSSKIKSFNFTSKDPNAEIALHKNLSSSQWTSIKKLVGTGTGYFRIKAWDGLNRESVSEIRSFTVQ